MITLTTRQRDILRVILEGNRAYSSAELARLLSITPRQVNYSIKGVKVWLNQHNQDLITLPGSGYIVQVTPEQAHLLAREISGRARFQVILSITQRQQLLALYLLSQEEPIILSQLEQDSQVSRMTIVKDLNQIEGWLKSRGIPLLRKPHFGIQISGSEKAVHQALAEVLWGETPFSSDRIFEISHAEGLVFNLVDDARSLPLAENARRMLSQINLRRAISLVAKAEEQLGGRFTDDAVLYMALAFAVMSLRVQAGHHFVIENEQLRWLMSLPIWGVADFIAQRLGRDTNTMWKPDDVAGIAMQMIAAPRNEILPGEIERYEDFSPLVENLLAYISKELEVSKLKHDRILQTGLLTLIVPACFRQRFQMWFPVSLITSLPEQDEREIRIAEEVTRMVFAHTGVNLSKSDVSDLLMLLRAAIIRNRNYRFEKVIVVCPSGMVTAQLLVARLRARFPYMGSVEVVSLRDLTPALVATADLVITTVPLPRQLSSGKVLQVHPLLMPEDIEAITCFLS